MLATDFVTCVMENPEFKYSPGYCVYINEKATLVAAHDRRGGGTNWHFAKIQVDEYTGFRFVYLNKKRISLKKILKNAWGQEYELPPLSSPPIYRDRYNMNNRLKYWRRHE